MLSPIDRTFLEELGAVLSQAEVHYAALGETAQRWTVRSRALDRTLPRREFDRRLRRRTELQGDLFWMLEAYLGVIARASLVLYPTPRKNKPYEARGVRLRALLFADEAAFPGGEHPIAARGLRNKWMHADEYLDEAFAALPPGGRYDRIFRDRFVDSQAEDREADIIIGQMRGSPTLKEVGGQMILPEDRRAFILRQFQVDTMRVHYLGEEFSLTDLHVAVQDLLPRVQRALVTDGATPPPSAAAAPAPAAGVPAADAT